MMARDEIVMTFVAFAMTKCSSATLTCQGACYLWYMPVSCGRVAGQASDNPNVELYYCLLRDYTRKAGSHRS